MALQDLLEFKLAPTLPLDQVESVENICTRSAPVE